MRLTNKHKLSKCTIVNVMWTKLKRVKESKTTKTERRKRERGSDVLYNFLLNNKFDWAK